MTDRILQDQAVEFCKVCGQGILMMCQKFTGYCSAQCEDEAKGKSWNG